MDHAPELIKGHAYCPTLDGLRTRCIVSTVGAQILGTLRFVNGSVGPGIFFLLGGGLIGPHRLGRGASSPWR